MSDQQSPPNAASPKAAPTTQNFTIDYAKSTEVAQSKLKHCRAFISLAKYLRDQSRFHQRSAGDHPSADDRENFASIKRQWTSLLGGTLVSGASEVLEQQFLDGAKAEFGKLDPNDHAAEAVAARKAWSDVVGLAEESKKTKLEVDGVIGELN